MSEQNSKRMTVVFIGEQHEEVMNRKQGIEETDRLAKNAAN